MAHTYNEAARVQKNAEAGLVWEQIVAGGATTFEAEKYQTVRVHAVAQTTVTIAGTVAMTLEAGETEKFNTGIGDISDKKRKVTVQITGSANVSVGRNVEKKREDAIAN